jgi:hypothetical protein
LQVGDSNTNKTTLGHIGNGIRSDELEIKDTMISDFSAPYLGTLLILSSLAD